MDEYKYTRTESWFLKEKTFTVEVKHWSNIGGFKGAVFDRDIIAHRWNVYITVFKTHPTFDALEKESQNYPLLEELHYGSTWCHWGYTENGDVVSKQYGSDYGHLHDEHFEECYGKEHPYAREIFFDAERLFDSFKEAQDYSIPESK